MNFCVCFVLFCFGMALQKASAQSDSLLMPMLKYYEAEKKIQEQHAQYFESFIRQADGKLLPDSVYQFLFLPHLPQNPTPTYSPSSPYLALPPIPQKKKNTKINH